VVDTIGPFDDEITATKWRDKNIIHEEYLGTVLPLTKPYSI